MVDCAVLAGCVDSLEDQEDCPFVLRVQHVLQFSQHAHTSLQSLFCAGMILGLESHGVGGVKVFEPELPAMRDAVFPGEFAGFFDYFFRDFKGAIRPSVNGTHPSVVFSKRNLNRMKRRGVWGREFVSLAMKLAGSVADLGRIGRSDRTILSHISKSRCGAPGPPQFRRYPPQTTAG